MTVGEWLVSKSSLVSGTALELISTITGGTLNYVPIQEFSTNVEQTVFDANIVLQSISLDIKSETFEASVSLDEISADIKIMEI